VLHQRVTPALTAMETIAALHQLLTATKSAPLSEEREEREGREVITEATLDLEAREEREDTAVLHARLSVMALDLVRLANTTEATTVSNTTEATTEARVAREVTTEAEEAREVTSAVREAREVTMVAREAREVKEDTSHLTTQPQVTTQFHLVTLALIA